MQEEPKELARSTHYPLQLSPRCLNTILILTKGGTNSRQRYILQNVRRHENRSARRLNERQLVRYVTAPGLIL